MFASKILPTALLVSAALLGIEAGKATVHAEEQFVVQFRLAQWRSSHMNDKQAAEKFSEGLKKIGCEVKVENHGNHVDVSYRCPQWRSLATTSDDSAHRWEDWLKKHGFQTAHQH